MGNHLFENRLEQDQVKIKENFKILLKRCADSALLLGKANLNILDLRRQKFYPELNYNYRQFSFPKEFIQNVFLGITCPKHLKKLQRSIKWDKL